MGHCLRVEDVGRGVVGDVLLHTLDWSVHSHHSYYRQDGSEYCYNNIIIHMENILVGKLADKIV